MKNKMKPLEKTDEKVCSAARVCIVDGKQFLEGMRCEHMCFSKISKDGKEVVEEASVEVTNLLEEFLDIVLDNVPDGLPLV